MSETIPTPIPRAWWQRLRGWLLSKVAVRIYWVVNVVLLLGTLGWILFDGKFHEAALQFIRHVRAFGNDESVLGVVTPLMWPRVDALWLVVVAASISAVGILAGLAAGSAQQRGIRSWLAVMILLAGWLTLYTTWPQIAWQGRVWRARSAISEFEKVSEALLADWPDSDGDLDGLGPYMAYPIGSPRTLMFMSIPRIPSTGYHVSTIQRGEEDTLHFQLAGNDEGVWLVRRSDDQGPQPFYSGLEGEYIPLRFHHIRGGWFLVQYMYAPIVPAEIPHSSPRR